LPIFTVKRMNNLLTDNPIALQALMSETIFTAGGAMDAVKDTSSPSDELEDTTPKVPDPSPTTSTSTSASAFPSSAHQRQEEFVYQGGNSTWILFILRCPQYPPFSPQAEEAFVRTIAALELTPQDAAVVNLANPRRPYDFKRIMA